MRLQISVLSVAPSMIAKASFQSSAFSNQARNSGDAEMGLSIPDVMLRATINGRCVSPPVLTSSLFKDNSFYREVFLQLLAQHGFYTTARSAIKPRVVRRPEGQFDRRCISVKTHHGVAVYNERR